MWIDRHSVEAGARTAGRERRREARLTDPHDVGLGELFDEQNVTAADEVGHRLLSTVDRCRSPGGG
jgi:hypothetical protein